MTQEERILFVRLLDAAKSAHRDIEYYRDLKRLGEKKINITFDLANYQLDEVIREADTYIVNAFQNIKHGSL